MQNTSIINCISEHLRECVIHDSFVACIVLDWKTAHNIKYYLLIDTITRTLGCHAVPSLQRLWVSVGMGLQVLLAQPKDPPDTCNVVAWQPSAYPRDARHRGKADGHLALVLTLTTATPFVHTP
jgi:hypothetical protein